MLLSHCIVTFWLAWHLLASHSCQLAAGSAVAPALAAPTLAAPVLVLLAALALKAAPGGPQNKNEWASMYQIGGWVRKRQAEAKQDIDDAASPETLESAVSAGARKGQNQSPTVEAWQGRDLVTCSQELRAFLLHARPSASLAPASSHPGGSPGTPCAMDAACIAAWPPPAPQRKACREAGPATHRRWPILFHGPSQVKWNAAGGKQACACFAAAACSRRLRTCPGPPFSRLRPVVTQRCGCRVDTRNRQQSALQPLSGHRTCQDWSGAWRARACAACCRMLHAHRQQASARTASSATSVTVPQSSRAPDALPASSRSSVHDQQPGLRPFPTATG